MQTRILAALLALLVAALPALAQPQTFPPNTVWGRLGVTAGPGQAIPMSRLPSLAASTAAISGGTITGSAISGGTISGAAIASAAITAGTISGTTISGGSIVGAALSGGSINLAAITNATITGLGNPVTGGDAANKQYVDAFVAGLIVQPQATYATAAVLPNTPTYDNGTLGVGATLTAGANSTLTVDGSVGVLNDIVLVKNQASALQNGPYKLTTVGSGSVPWVLTRVTYFDQAAEMQAKSYIYVTAGTANANTAWVLQTSVATVGTDTLIWNLYSTQVNAWTVSSSNAYRASGNVGIGGAPSAWSGFEVLQISSIALGRNSGDDASIFANVYFDGANYKYINNGTAALTGVNDSGGFSFYTAPSGTAGNTATVTQRAYLSNLGVLTLGAYGAGIPNFSASGVVSSKKDYTTSVIYAANYGVVADGSTSNNTTLQNAINACSGFPAVSNGKACILQLPCGVINVSTGFTATYAMIVQGCGAGEGQLPGGSPANDYGGTVINQSCTTCITFLFTTLQPVQVRDIGFNGPFNATAGSWIYIRPEVSPATNPNRHSIISNNTSIGGYQFLVCELCGNYTIANNAIQGFVENGIYLTASVLLADNGDATIIANTLGTWAGGAPAPGSCIHQQTQSAVKIIGNKILGCGVGIRTIADQGTAGTLIIQGNSIEGMTVNFIRFEQASSGKTYGSIIITGNQMLNNDAYANPFQGGIVFVTGAEKYIDRVTIADNHIIFGAPTPATTATCISINHAQDVLIHNNLCNAEGVAGWGGITVGSNASNVKVLDNVVINVGAGALQYDLSSTTLLRDMNGMLAAKLGSWGNGSQVYVSDAASGACGAGAGTTAFRQGGAWKCF